MHLKYVYAGTLYTVRTMSTADDVLSDACFQSSKLLKLFVVIMKITELRQVEEIRHHVSLSLNRERKPSAGS